MIIFRIFGRRISFCFSFFAMTALLVLTDSSGYIGIGIYACVLHELGHLTAMALLDIPVSEIRFYCAGIKLIHAKRLLPTAHEALILLSGSAVNLFCFFSLYFLPLENIRIKLFAVMSLLVGVFNLLPAETLDGGRLLSLTGIFPRLSASEGVKKTAALLLTAAFIALAALGISTGKISPSVAVTAVFIILISSR